MRVHIVNSFDTSLHMIKLALSPNIFRALAYGHGTLRILRLKTSYNVMWEIILKLFNMGVPVQPQI